VSDFSPSIIFAGIIFSAFGIYFFRLGKRETNYALFFIGVTLFVFPYFTSNPVATWGIGAALLGLGFYIRGR
jgi:hypothetical protein